MQRHFGEVAFHSSGAFAIEKCFTACNLSLREAIVSELLAVHSELSKTKQGSYLLKKLDVGRYAIGYLWYCGMARFITICWEFFFFFNPLVSIKST